MATQRKGLRGYRLSILAIVGALLAIFGAVWVAVIFPAVDKMPSDYEQTYYFDGQFQVMDPATMSLVPIPIEQTLEQKAVGTEDGALLIHEVRTVTNAVTGEDMSALYGDETTLAIDPRTLEYVTQVDERGRWGYFGPPRPLEKGQSFDLWNPGANLALTAEYSHEETFRDLNVYVYRIEASGIPIGKDPTSGMDLFLSPGITLWIEPSSGTVVNQTSSTLTSIDMMGQTVPVQIATVNYAETTINNLMDTAISARWMLLWFRTLVPWIAIGFGCVLVCASGVIVLVRNMRRVKSTEPKPTSLPMDV